MFVYAYCPALGRGVLSAPAYRRSKRLDMSLPDEFAGQELHFYGFVTDYAQRASETCYIMVDAPQTVETRPAASPYETWVSNANWETRQAASLQRDCYSRTISS